MHVPNCTSFQHTTLVLSFYIDVILTLTIQRSMESSVEVKSIIYTYTYILHVSIYLFNYVDILCHTKIYHVDRCFIHSEVFVILYKYLQAENYLPTHPLCTLGGHYWYQWYHSRRSSFDLKLFMRSEITLANQIASVTDSILILLCIHIKRLTLIKWICLSHMLG